MSQRLDQDREKELTPNRFQYAMDKLNELGIGEINIDDTKIQFKHNGETITLYPYSGWFSGKTVKDGRGIDLLLKQITPLT